MRPTTNPARLALFSLLTLASLRLVPAGSQDPGGRFAALHELANHLTVEYLDDGAGGVVKTFRITGANVQLVNGTGRTRDGNGLGNLILGYSEPGRDPKPRTGSHVLDIGLGNGWESSAGIVVGTDNFLRANHASIIGGNGNRARGGGSTILGGVGGITSGASAVVAGGFQNSGSGARSFVGGGRHNVASGKTSFVGGGSANRAIEWLATAVGGSDNTARASWATTTGGWKNNAWGEYSSVSGGHGNDATGRWSAIAFGRGRSIDEMNQSGNTDHDGVAGSIWQDD